MIARKNRSRFQGERQQHQEFGGWLGNDREFERLDPLQLIGPVRARTSGSVIIVRIGVGIARQQRFGMVCGAELAQAKARRQEQWQACCHDQNSHQGQQRFAPESSVSLTPFYRTREVRSIHPAPRTTPRMTGPAMRRKAPLSRQRATNRDSG